MAAPSFSTEATPVRPPLCAAAPVLWSLLPLMAGIALGNRASPWLAGSLAALALLFLLIRCVPRSRAFRPGSVQAALAWVRAGPEEWILLLSLLAGLLLGHQAANHPHPGWADQPPREARLDLRIEETFNARKDARIAGTGTILRSSLPVDTLTGRRAAFYLESGPLGSDPPAIGQVISCRAVVTCLPWVGEPDGYEAYLLRRDIFLSLNQGTVLSLRRPAGPVEQLRQRLYGASQRVLSHGSRGPDAPGNVLASMLLGNRSLLSDERIDLYRHTGTYHLFAVSGLHVGSVALCLVFLCRLARLRGGLQVIPVLAATWGYVWLTGSSPSAVRAGIMISCIALSRSLLRQPHLFPALVFSAWLVLIWQPTQLFHLGFQLSYGVVASIVLVGLPLARDLRNRLNRHAAFLGRGGPRRRLLLKSLVWSSDLTCVSLSAGLASMPLIIQHFGLFTPAGVVLGILLNPMATACVMTGCITLLATPLLGTGLAGWLALAAWPVIRLMEFLLRVCLSIPGAVSNRSWTWPPTGTLVLLSMLVAAWFLQRARMRTLPLPAATHLLPFAIVLAALGMTAVDT
jgi:competence protein ComEC